MPEPEWTSAKLGGAVCLLVYVTCGPVYAFFALEGTFLSSLLVLTIRKVALAK